MIRCFEVVSGLKVNLHKSRMYGVGNVVQIDRLAGCLGYSVGHLPTTWPSVGSCIQKYYYLEPYGFSHSKKACRMER